MLKAIKPALMRLKLYLRWVIIGVTLFFLGKTVKDNWREVAVIHINGVGWGMLALALFVTLLAHIWAAWVWSWILCWFKQNIPLSFAVRVYLKTNIAKYLPGNVWHFYARIFAMTEVGVPPGVATLSVLLEPLLMAVAALSLALAGIPGLLAIPGLLCASVALLLIHPRILNPALQLAAQAKGATSEVIRLERYPLVLLLGEVGFLGLRGAGFLLTLAAIVSPETLHIKILYKLPLLLSAFSFAWLLGLVVPGAPGGIGVFEATVTGILERDFGAAALLSAAAFYRLTSVLAEVMGALIGAKKLCCFIFKLK
ncbi:MAG: UPF0104 family protein [Oscillatoriaceae bacterium SKW80]|nr:UPF0104 family protein [Oscillatoriaceae bacterium SKYG93]MCX8119886.1 UPF0104 family protein [Oscillatoriaceae bacterium SKW80]MDW8452007.1 lysylphosphatidylglycerol synthase domain-containing protein [Oscillatoriaceae cyanobacterium SKYGB_i_bin93]HIK27551.1 flippase-like domain-containing protein [Oscillatoriaceae cyanobacterium M7585_C2015_266]